MTETVCRLVSVKPNAAPEPCEYPGCYRSQAATFVLYRVGANAWRMGGRYRCDEHPLVLA